MGVPGKVVRQVSDDDLVRIKRTAEHYLDMARRYAAGGFVAPWEKRP